MSCTPVPGCTTKFSTDCSNGYQYVTQGYRKIPGNKCEGGIDLEWIKVSCTTSGSSTTGGEDSVSSTSVQHKSKAVIVVVVFVVILVIGGVAGGLFYLNKKKKFVSLHQFRPLGFGDKGDTALDDDLLVARDQDDT